MTETRSDISVKPAPDMTPTALGRAALTAFLADEGESCGRHAAITAALVHITPAAVSDPAGVYGALHGLAGMLDALRHADDLATAVASRADRYRDAGAALLALHVDAARPWPLVRVDMDPAGAGIRGGVPRLMLRPQKAYGTIRLDAVTTLCNVPGAVWEHRIGEDALLEIEFTTWRARAAALGPDVGVDKDALTQRIAWLCRVGVETASLLSRA